MKRQLIIIFKLIILFLSFNHYGQTSDKNSETIIKIEMDLSAFGVESDDFPSINATVDFSKNKSLCVKSYYHPDYKGSTYSLKKSEIQDLIDLLKISDVKKLKTKYEVSKTDQATSTIIIYTTKTKYIITDYGLQGEYPLKEIYKIVYKY